jgi:hypothetical protein
MKRSEKLADVRFFLSADLVVRFDTLTTTAKVMRQVNRILPEVPEFMGIEAVREDGSVMCWRPGLDWQVGRIQNAPAIAVQPQRVRDTSDDLGFGYVDSAIELGVSVASFPTLAGGEITKTCRSGEVVALPNAIIAHVVIPGGVGRCDGACGSRDVTENVLALELDEIHQLTDDSALACALVGADAMSLPFRVQVADAVASYFDARGTLQSITSADLMQCRHIHDVITPQQSLDPDMPFRF